MNKNSTSKTSMTDEYPEVTQPDLDRAVFRRGLEPAEKKQRITIMLDSGVIGYFKEKAGQRGYQTLINEFLKKNIEQDSLEKKLRQIIREELDQAIHSH